MKIKTKKEMTLPQLIEWTIKKDIKDEKFYSKNGCHISIDFRGHAFLWDIRLNEIFTVEIEEEITEDTKLDTLIEVYTEDSETIVHDIGRNIMNDFDRETPEVAINDVCSSDTLELHTLIGGKLVKIWSKEKGLVE